MLTEPHIHVDGVRNFRPVVVPAPRYGPLRSDRLFRSGTLVGLSDAGRATIARLGITDVVDLRSAVDMGGNEHPDVGPAIRVHDMGRYIIEPKQGSKAQKVEGTYTLDTNKMPPTIDMKPTTGRYKDKTLKGIYKISENKLVICFADPDKDRPKDFESKPGSGTTVAIHIKAK